MRAVIPLLRLFFRLPVLAFKLAGVVRVTNRARRDFKRTLNAEGLPEDVVEELGEGLMPDMFNIL
jgi:hypothetical protein